LTFLSFPKAIKLIQKIGKKYNLGYDASEAAIKAEWIKFTKTKNFEAYKKMIPKRPDIYYKKENVLKKLKEIKKSVIKKNMAKKLDVKRKTKKVKRKTKKAFGGYSINFKNRKETIEQVFGKADIPPSLMTKKLWNFIKAKGLGHK
tara:strand:- start:1920 stop:2357 length:438 start_codon:yes stop_codon:yes gene_type:complete